MAMRCDSYGGMHCTRGIYTTVELWWWTGVVLGDDGCFEVGKNAVKRSRWGKGIQQMTWVCSTVTVFFSSAAVRTVGAPLHHVVDLYNVPDGKPYFSAAA